MGVITGVHGLKRLRPSVMILLDKDKRPASDFLTLDLSLVERDEHGQPLGVKGGLPAGGGGGDTHECVLD